MLRRIRLRLLSGGSIVASQHYLIFAARYAPEVGGIESYTANLTDELVRQGHAVTIVTSAISAVLGRTKQDNGVEVVRLPCVALMGGRFPLVKRSAQTRELLEGLCRLGVTRVLVNARFYELSLVGLKVARKMSVPVVLLDHGSAYLTLGNPVLDLALRAYEHTLTALGKRPDVRYAGVSSMSARWLRTFGINTECVIPNAIDAPSFRGEASSRAFRDELGVRSGQTLVTSVGRLSPEKGSRELVEAARILGEDVQVAIAGEGSLRQELTRGLPANVTLLGNLNHADLSALLRDSDLFCLPTRSEGFCTSLLEAGAWGLMPLMTHVGGTDEVMGSPVRYGMLLEDMGAQTVARTIDAAVQACMTGHSDGFRCHVEKSCSWSATVDALDGAYT